MLSLFSCSVLIYLLRGFFAPSSSWSTPCSTHPSSLPSSVRSQSLPVPRPSAPRFLVPASCRFGSLLGSRFVHFMPGQLPDCTAWMPASLAARSVGGDRGGRRVAGRDGVSCDVIAVGVDSGRIIIGTLLVVVVFAVAKLGRPESQNESHSSDDDHALGR